MLLFERVTSPSARVDRAAGIIKDCKVLGLVSANGRRYLPDAVRAALPMYEGVAVNLDHPADPLTGRMVSDRVGYLEGVYMKPDGIYGTLRFLLPLSEAAQRVFDAAERNPKLFGLSHNAEGHTQRVGTEVVVSEITSVHSVDLVADPATTGGLFESLTGVQSMTTERFVEEITNPEPAAEPSPVSKSAEAGFRSIVMAVLDDRGLDIKGKVAAIKQILVTQEQLLGKIAPTAESRRPAVVRNPWDGPSAAETADLVWNIT